MVGDGMVLIFHVLVQLYVQVLSEPVVYSVNSQNKQHSIWNL